MKRNSKSVSVLVIGNLGPWLKPDNTLPMIKDSIFCLYTDLTAEFLNKHQPDMILSPIVASQFDIFELAGKLHNLHFSGRFRGICGPLPNLKIIIAEVSEQCPDLDFDLIVVGPDRTLRSV